MRDAVRVHCQYQISLRMRDHGQAYSSDVNTVDHRTLLRAATKHVHGLLFVLALEGYTRGKSGDRSVLRLGRLVNFETQSMYGHDLAKRSDDKISGIRVLLRQMLGWTAVRMSA